MKPLHIAFSVFICFLWGVNFAASKSAVGYFPTFFLLTLRLTIVSIILLPFIKKPLIPWSDLVNIAVVFTVIHFGFMFLSLEKGLDVSVAVVVDQLRVPFAVIFGYFLLGERADKKTIAGIAISIVGTFVIVGTPNIIENYIAFWFLMIASAGWALYNIKIKNLGEIDLFSFIGWMAIIGAPILFTISFIYEGNQFGLLINPPVEAVVSLLYVSIVVTIVAHGGWYYLLKIYPVNKVVPFSLIVPVFGVVAGVLMMNEILTWQILSGGLLTLLGVGIVVIKNPKAAREGDEI